MVYENKMMWIKKMMVGLVLGKGWLMLHLSVQVESLWTLRSSPLVNAWQSQSAFWNQVGWALGGLVLSLEVWWAAWILAAGLELGGQAGLGACAGLGVLPCSIAAGALR